MKGEKGLVSFEGKEKKKILSIKLFCTVEVGLR